MYLVLITQIYAAHIEAADIGELLVHLSSEVVFAVVPVLYYDTFISVIHVNFFYIMFSLFHLLYIIIQESSNCEIMDPVPGGIFGLILIEKCLSWDSCFIVCFSSHYLDGVSGGLLKPLVLRVRFMHRSTAPTQFVSLYGQPRMTSLGLMWYPFILIIGT